MKIQVVGEEEEEWMSQKHMHKRAQQKKRRSRQSVWQWWWWCMQHEMRLVDPLASNWVTCVLHLQTFIYVRRVFLVERNKQRVRWRWRRGEKRQKHIYWMRWAWAFLRNAWQRCQWNWIRITITHFTTDFIMGMTMMMMRWAYWFLNVY